jgi:hypothetical protein
MPLDAGWAGVIGAAIGVTGTIAGAIVTHWLQNRRAASLAEKRRERLKRTLSGEKYTWISMATLAASIGADESTTAELLIEIDARASLTNNGSWALLSRAPWPAETQPDN